jgi:hypothetical protein
MDFYLIQGWSTPFFGAEFTAASAAVKPEKPRKPDERLAKGSTVRVGPRMVSIAAIDPALKCSSRKTPRCVFANKNNNEVLRHAVNPAPDLPAPPLFPLLIVYACRRRYRLREAKPPHLKHPQKQQLPWRQK